MGCKIPFDLIEEAKSSNSSLLNFFLGWFEFAIIDEIGRSLKLSEFVSSSLVCLLGAMSPGPSLALIINNSINYNRTP